MDQKQLEDAVPPSFGGKPGEQVPQVDAEDLKKCWQLSHEHPEEKAIGVCLLEAVCKPGADVQAVSYRAMLLALILMPLAESRPSLGGEELAPWVKDGSLDDAVFRAAAQTPMEWVGVGVVRQGLPFNLDEFMRRVREYQEGGMRRTLVSSGGCSQCDAHDDLLKRLQSPGPPGHCTYLLGLSSIRHLGDVKIEAGAGE